MLEIDVAEITQEARVWLEETVAKERDWMNFEIMNVNNIHCLEQQETIRFDFQCRYIWLLNGWSKSVDREINVIYKLNTGEITSAL